MKRLILILLVLCAALPSFPEEHGTKDGTVGEENRKYSYYYQEAIRLKMKKEYAAAFDLLQHCLAIRPDASSALYELAQYYVYLKQPERSMALLERAVANAPDNYWYAQGLANLYLQQQQPDRAADLLEQMALRFDDRLDPLYTLLDIYTRQEKYDKVLHLLNRLEKRMGKNEQLAMEKFRIYLQKQDTKRAFREIENLVREYPLDMHYRVILGDLYLQHNKEKRAYETYRQVLQKEPDNAQALYSLANYYDQTGQKELYRQQLDTLLLNRKVTPETKLNVMRRFIVENEQAGRDSIRVITLFDRVLEQETDDAQLPLLYAQYLINKGMDSLAVAPLRRVVAIEPENTPARMTLLSDAIRREDYADIITLSKAGVEATPDMLEFYYYLAIAYNHENQTDLSLATCEEAVKHLTPQSNPQVVSDFYTIIGDSYHSKGENVKAYAAYDNALKHNPDNIGALNNYAYYLSLEKRDLDRAEEMSYRTVKAEPKNATYLDTYAWILFEKGNYAEARIYIDEAMKYKEGYESDVVVEHCGDIHALTGDIEGALKYWQQALDMGSTSKTLKQKINLKKYIADEIKLVQ